MNQDTPAPSARRGRAPSDLAALLADFQARFPDAWEDCRTWPTESGLAHIAATLKAPADRR